MSKIDIVFAVLMLVFFFLGFRKGIAASLISLAGLLLSIVLIARFAPLVKVGLMEKLSLNHAFSTILAYLLIFLTIMVLVKIVIIIMDKVIKTLKLSWLNKSLGGFFGIINYIVFLMILFYILQIIPGNETIINSLENSKTISFIKYLTDQFDILVVNKIPRPVSPV